MENQNKTSDSQPVELNDHERKRLIAEIYDAGRKVTVGDVMQRTGLPAASVAVTLRDLAFQSKAHILVDSSGNVAYRFKYGFQRQLRIPLKAILRFLWLLPGNMCSGLMKLAFGITLMLSCSTFILPLMLCAIVKSIIDFINLNDQTDERATILDLKNWPRVLGGALRTEIRHAGKAMPSNIFLDCYSFVFGDGDPNPDLEERKWRKLAELIKRNNGVLVCEQLAPYLGRKPKEDDMIPVMVHFDGTPEVTDSGNLVYAFPQASISFAGQSQHSEAKVDEDAGSLQERYWRQTGISTASNVWISSLALLNAVSMFALLVFVCYYETAYKMIFLPIVWFLEQHLMWLWHALVGLFHILFGLFHLIGLWGIIGGTLAMIVIAPCLFLLSWFFVIYPPLRFLVNQIKNIPIWLRNEQRRRLAVELTRPSKELSLKLIEAQEHSPVKIKIDEDHVLFDSSKDSLEQEFRR